jgi:probable rRNA maturation factor
MKSSKQAVASRDTTQALFTQALSTQARRMNANGEPGPAPCLVEASWSVPRSIWAPADTTIQHWVDLAISAGTTADAELAEAEGLEIALLLTDAAEIQQLNRDYRQQDKPTNVLSFPMRSTIEDNRLLLGDLVICPAIVEAEALAQGKQVGAHFMHLVIHGVLHLLGYDHIDDADAAVMEALEIDLLAKLEVADPYR